MVPRCSWGFNDSFHWFRSGEKSVNWFVRYRAKIFISMSLLGLVVLANIVFMKQDPYQWLYTLPKPWTLSPDEVTEILPRFQQHFPDFQERLKAFAIWRVGTPYEIFKLGEEIAPDPDPLIRLDVSDCTAHVLTTLAFAQSNSWQEARQNMIRIHYKPDGSGRKIPTYKTRWHFTADRITANPYTVNITDSLLAADKLAAVKITLNQEADGSEFLPLDWTRAVELKYIPNDQITPELMKRLPDVCGVAFVKKSYFKKGIFFGHEGMIIDRQELIHASQSVGKTARVDFLDYYFSSSGPIFDGIMIYRFVPFSSH